MLHLCDLFTEYWPSLFVLVMSCVIVASIIQGVFNKRKGTVMRVQITQDIIVPKGIVSHAHNSSHDAHRWSSQSMCIDMNWKEDLYGLKICIATNRVFLCSVKRNHPNPCKKRKKNLILIDFSAFLLKLVNTHRYRMSKGIICGLGCFGIIFTIYRCKKSEKAIKTLCWKMRTWENRILSSEELKPIKNYIVWLKSNI